MLVFIKTLLLSKIQFSLNKKQLTECYYCVFFDLAKWLTGRTLNRPSVCPDHPSVFMSVDLVVFFWYIISIDDLLYTKSHQQNIKQTVNQQTTTSQAKKRVAFFNITATTKKSYRKKLNLWKQQQDSYRIQKKTDRTTKNVISVLLNGFSCRHCITIAPTKRNTPNKIFATKLLRNSTGPKFLN